MPIAVQGQWEALSGQFAEAAAHADKFIVAVHGGRRVAGSGILWRAGVVVTASHMVRRDEMEVTLADKSTRKATLAGRDPGSDVAVLRIESEQAGVLPQFGDTTDLRVGYLVLAVGRSTLGDLAATAGIVARLGAAWQTWRGGKIDSLLRPDVTLYPGQSGSALVDSKARLLGMNTAALARAATITVPTATIERVAGEILQHGGVFRPYLGLAMQPVVIPPDLASKLKIADESALMVMQVEPESPSATAGMMLGDIILKINEQPVSRIEQIQTALGSAKRGDSVTLTYARGGELGTSKVKLADRPR
ncbi:MAG TPA: trypsin-like peptidase domain-containing protein, partial [Terriglobales bacterium]|nr:trypsin-like peptidase domain-containing protein [Terriglobales bacterium]